MSSLLRGLVLMATAGALTFPSTPPASVLSQSTNGTGRGRAVARTTAPGVKASTLYKESNLEYYLTDDGISYIRPGVKITILSFTNYGPGQNPVVDFTLTDSQDQPLDRLGKVTPGAIAPSFIFARWDADRRYYFPLTTSVRNGATRPSADSNGTWEDIAVGHYKYTFATKLPANLDVTKTYTLGAYARRSLNAIIGKDYYADNVYKDVRPDGQAAGQVWAAMDTNKTCNRCHDPLALHGGTRRDVKLCELCHNDQVTKDTTSGETFNGKIFFHKLHMGENLPSVKAGKSYIAGGDWSTVAFPQDIRNCTTCHDTTAKEADIWLTRPNRDACGSCHDDINWVTGENHAGGAQTSDAACAKCHIPDSGEEFDASIKGAHTIPLKSKQLTGYTASIVSVTNAAPGKKPTVVFSVKTAAGTPVDATKLSSFGPKWAINTGSYYNYKSESGLATGTTPGSYDASTGNTTYTFTNAIPADAKGTIAFSADIYNSVNVKRVDNKPAIAVRDAALNPVKYVSLDGSTVAPRRTSVTMAQCNQCHQDLALHGDQRKNIEECVMCHNPTEGDQSRRPATAGAKESVSFQRLIHRIHTGEELTQEFTVYGFGGSKNNFNEVRFPGDRRNCAKCHVNTAAYSVPVAATAQPVTTLRDYFSPQGANTAACLGCHDDQNAAAHAYLNVATFPGATTQTEACSACHGTGKEFDVAKVHAR